MRRLIGRMGPRRKREKRSKVFPDRLASFEMAFKSQCRVYVVQIQITDQLTFGSCLLTYHSMDSSQITI